MTEKRFTLLVDGDEIYCTDNQGYGFNYPMYDVPSAKDMIKLLNKLSDENEQLKTRLDFCSSVNKETNKQIKLVEGENEQLKKDLEYKERVIKQYQQSQEENMKYCEGDVE